MTVIVPVPPEDPIDTSLLSSSDGAPIPMVIGFPQLLTHGLPLNDCTHSSDESKICRFVSEDDVPDSSQKSLCAKTSFTLGSALIA